jgi:hypothetical protein
MLIWFKRLIKRKLDDDRAARYRGPSNWRF